MNVPELFALAVSRHQAGDLARAEAGYREILAREPEHPDALHLLGVLALQRDRAELAVELIDHALHLRPVFPEAHNNLGNALKSLGRLPEAVAAYQSAVSQNPGYAKAWHNLGVGERMNGRGDAAQAALRRAVALAPQWVEAQRSLGDLLMAAGDNLGAVAAYTAALALAPDNGVIANNLALALRQLDRVDAAIALLESALQRQPDFRAARLNLATLLRQRGDYAASLACFRVALRTGPVPASGHSGYLFLLHYDPACGPAELLTEHRAWAAQHATPLAASPRWHGNIREPARRLRIGYVSADLRDHPVGRNVHPLFAHRDCAACEIHVYAHVDAPDAMTDRLRAQADRWHDITALDDAQLAARVRADAIDVLVDLSLHTDGNRLLAFARKPAPVQVTFAGYPGTTGLAAIDYRLTDPFLDPSAGRDEFYAERSFRLPHSFWCFDPLGDDRPARGPRNPATPFTWGCLNNPIKISAPVLEAWARILGATPDTRLLVLAHNAYHRDRIAQALAHHGIGAGRVEFVAKQPRAAYLENYRRCDVILDTIPYNGHTTACDALWMGVPVVTLAGLTAVGRGGLSLLSNLGLAELVATSEDDYVRTALDLARDPARLASLHATLRARMTASPLMDGVAFARGIEAAYRAMWRAWCETARP